MYSNQAFEIKKILEEITKNAFKNLSDKEVNGYCKFFLEISDKCVRSYTGKYNPATKNIIIIGKNRALKYNLIISFHELAHHICFLTYKDIQMEHKADFYRIYNQIIQSALDMEIVTTKELKMACDSIDLDHIVDLLIHYTRKSKFENKNEYIIKVQNAYDKRELLSENGFQWKQEDKCWEYKTNNLKKILKL